MCNLTVRPYHVLQELAQFDHQIGDTSVVLKMDNTRDLDMDLILKNVEAWYQNIAHTSKQEAEAFYHNKVSQSTRINPHLGFSADDQYLAQQEYSCPFIHTIMYGHGAISAQGTIVMLECAAWNVATQVLDLNISTQAARQRPFFHVPGSRLFSSNDLSTLQQTY